jgi:hypothetical protein|nr:MAG TPA: hydrolase [Caudoviricetes sp.]
MEKTCGNCNLADFDLMRCDYFDDNGVHEAITKNKPACEDWIKRALTDEERYQQLTEVAREMYEDLDDLPSGAEGFRRKLEELGVEL